MLIFEDDVALRAAIGSILSIVAAVAYRELEPYVAPSVNLLSTSAMWLVRRRCHQRSMPSTLS